MSLYLKYVNNLRHTNEHAKHSTCYYFKWVLLLLRNTCCRFSPYINNRFTFDNTRYHATSRWRQRRVLWQTVIGCYVYIVNCFFSITPYVTEIQTVNITSQQRQDFTFARRSSYRLYVMFISSTASSASDRTSQRYGLSKL